MEHEQNKNTNISANMVILDVISEHPKTEAVFKLYDEQAGECICCMMLFETVQLVAEKYHLNLTELLSKLNSASVD